MIRLFTYMACLASTLSLSTPANASGNTAWGHVTYMGSGWSVNDFWVKTTTTAINPDNCATPSNGYTIDPTSANLQILEALLMTAYAHGDYVQIAVSGCSAGSPAIVGVYLQAQAS